MNTSLPLSLRIPTAPARRDVSRHISPLSDRKPVIPLSNGISPLTITNGQCRSAFEAAMVFITARRCSPPTKRHHAYVCFLRENRVIEVTRLAELRGYNPILNLAPIAKQAKLLGVNEVILCTWHGPSAEEPFAEEQMDEVVSQYESLRDLFGINLVDNIRLSDTSFYSYYADQERPFSPPRRELNPSMGRLY